ncbi:hypothetical protein HMPREF9123_0296 [Neisseria bacilliformis ATCC BAA-1200]|uniref:Uncharacterized protein n=1 Tax=Neisseria bacilliformis ATCC BAA-1200 TaxID=888742 RepID=F2B951_9NEIS|nr:hypothetical protein HMPREF9123_0296 [Neisseria bacilliformis ATCC BAA-1200]
MLSDGLCRICGMQALRDRVRGCAAHPTHFQTAFICRRRFC